MDKRTVVSAHQRLTSDASQNIMISVTLLLVLAGNVPAEFPDSGVAKTEPVLAPIYEPLSPYSPYYSSYAYPANPSRTPRSPYGMIRYEKTANAKPSLATNPPKELPAVPVSRPISKSAPQPITLPAGELLPPPILGLPQSR
jgi:hypothetical protein